MSITSGDGGLAEDEALLARRCAKPARSAFLISGRVSPAASRRTTARSAKPTSPSMNCCMTGCAPRARTMAGSRRRRADDPARLDAERVWIVDPIDGTRTFLAGEPRWTVAVALVENGRAVLGAVFAPAQSEFYFARGGGGASVNGVPIQISAQDVIEGSRVITAPRMLKSDRWPEPWPAVQPIWVQSMTYRLAMIASGQADATLALSAQSEWDLAAAILLVEEAGGRATDAAGRPLRFNQANPRINGLVAAGPGLHELLVARTRPVALDN